ncbi:MAG: MFS transporter [Betaproteobacteria bacterium]|jgi:MFS family permease|nr:MFS transporter [Betaproteobacteria bacterium]
MAAAARTAARPSLPGDFRRFLWVRLAGTAANQMLLVALGWQMYDLTSSAWDLGLVGLLQFVPALLLTIPAGQLVDRVDRRAVIAASLALQAGVAGVLGATSATGIVGRELILALAVVIGVARALQMPAQQALAPTLVEPAMLPQALATSSSVMQVAIIGGPALGGFLYALGGAATYGVAFALLLVAIGAAASIRRRPAAAARAPVTLASLFAGFGFIFRQKVVLGAMSLDLFAVLLGGATALLPMFAKDVLDTGAWGLGLLRAAPAAGAFLTGVTLAHRPLRGRVGGWMFGSVAVYGLATLAFALSTVFVLSLLALAVSGAADTVSVIIRQTLVQLETPDNMRGRVSAVNATFIGASNQLGEFRAGAVAAWLGPVGSVIVGALGTLLVVGLWMKLFPSLVRRDRLA